MLGRKADFAQASPVVPEQDLSDNNVSEIAELPEVMEDSQEEEVPF